MYEIPLQSMKSVSPQNKSLNDEDNFSTLSRNKTKNHNFGGPVVTRIKLNQKSTENFTRKRMMNNKTAQGHRTKVDNLLKVDIDV